MPRYKKHSIIKKEGRNRPWKKPQPGYVVKGPRDKFHIVGSWRPTLKKAKKYVDSVIKERQGRR